MSANATVATYSSGGWQGHVSYQYYVFGKPFPIETEFSIAAHGVMYKNSCEFHI